MKFLKISFGIVVGIILLLVVGGGIFIATFDANQYKSLIREQVQQQTGREFNVADIKPSVFPWLGLELQQISLSNASGFKAQNMLQMQRLDVRLELLPLLSQQIHIDTLKVHGLELFLEKDKTGKTNWDDLLQKNAQPPKSQATSQPAAIETNNTRDADPLANVVINGMQLNAANIHWADASTGKNIALNNINISTGALRAGEDLPLSLSSEVALSEPAAQVKVNLKTRLKYNLAERQYVFTELVLDVNAQLQQQALSQIQLTLNAELSADLKQQRFDLSDYVLQLQLQGSATGDKKIPVFIAGSVKADLQKQIVEIKPFALQSDEVDINLNVMIKQLLDAPVMDGTFALEDFNPRALANVLGIELPKMQNNAALKKAALSFNVAADEQQLNLSSLTLKLDQSTLLGKVQVKQFDNPEIVYSVKLNQLVLDDYLPPPSNTAAEQKKTLKTNGAQKTDTPIELPTELLRNLNVNGIFQAASIVVAKQRVSNLKIKTLAKAGLIKLPEISAQVLQGQLNASAKLDVRKKNPRYQFKMKGEGLKAESIVNPILQDMLGEKSVSMSGKTHVAMNIKTQGQSLKQLIAGSYGTLKLNMSKAELHGVDAEYFVRKGVVDFLEQKKQPVPQDWRGEYKPKDTTALKVARASATIKNGVVDNKDLLLKSSRFNISGAGKINLPKELLDYRVVVDVNPSKTKTAGERLLDVPMPIFVKGSFAQPDISIDSKVWLKSVGKELKAEVKAEIKKKVKKEKDEKIDKLKNKYRDKLKKLFR